MAEDEKSKATEEPIEEPDKGKETDWKAEADKWKALARKHEQQAKSNADAAKKLSEIEDKDKTEQQRMADKVSVAEGRAARAEQELARLKVAMRKGLTETQAKRLVGETEEELEADADDLLASFSSKDEDRDDKSDTSRRPKERLRSGAAPDEEPEETNPRKLAELVPRI